MFHAALLLALAPAPQIQGMVEIPAGQTLLGDDLETIKKLLASKPQLAGQLGGEIPRSTVDVPAFWIGKTEVTNEMYLRFVQATGYQPPVSWLVLTPEELQEIIREEKKNDPSWTFEGLRKVNWWDKHWRDEGRVWRMAAEEALLPVVNVSLDDAHAYCRWAGLRLPTEIEWVRAARGDDPRSYPFGNEFDRKLVSHDNTDPTPLRIKLLPVNWSPANASPFGCVDMVGNAWEWTDSRYTALPDFKTFTVKAGKDKVAVLPPFDGSSPVLRGGSFMDPPLGTRIDRRQGVMSVARTDHIGFRLASSTRSCVNAARYCIEFIDVRVIDGMPEEKLDAEQAIGLEKRRYADLAEQQAARAEPVLRGLEQTVPPEGYAVFDGYDTITVLPMRELDFASNTKLAQAGENSPVPVGVLTTTVPLATPNLPAGNYVLGYLPGLDDKGILALGATLPPEFAEKAPKSASVDEEREGADFSGIELTPEVEYMAFLDANKAVVLAVVPLRVQTKPDFDLMGQLKHGVTIDLGRRNLLYQIRVPEPRAKKGFAFGFALVPLKDAEMVARGYWDGSDYEVREPEPGK